MWRLHPRQAEAGDEPMRWLAIHLPDLPLEVYSRGLACPGPLAVSVRQRGERILLCNQAAADAGVVLGMGLGAAQAIAPGLRVRPRAEAAERDTLERLATWAGRFSSRVSLAPPAGVLLEAAGSLRLFKGGDGLLRQVGEGLDRLGYRHGLCLAPTPGSALLLAAHSPSFRQVTEIEMRPVVARLPLLVLGLEEAALESLLGIGLYRIGDLLRLPRAGLGKRLGAEWLQRLDRILGQAPDPQPVFEPPVFFSSALELPAEVESVDGLIFAARRLLDELEGFLYARGLGARRLQWHLHYRQGEEGRFELGLANSTRDAGRLMGLLRERLNRVELPAPVLRIGLVVRDIEPLPEHSAELFATSGSIQAEMGNLLERLRARLGDDAVSGIRMLPEHRPEKGWVYCSPGQVGKKAGKVPPPCRADRPLWLLPKPVPLPQHKGRPCREGQPLVFEGERERIEAGWWDGADVRRDYFIAHTPAGERLWVYRELDGEDRWYLHGIFS